MNLDPMSRKISRALGQIRLAFRAVLTSIDTSAPAALVQADALAGEQLQDNELMQHFGFTSAPPNGTSLVVIPIGGKTAHGIVIATEHGTYRLKGLKSGEVALYDDQGQSVYLTRTGIVVDGGGLPVMIKNTPTVTADTPMFHIKGSLNVDQNIVAQGDIADQGNKTMSGMRATYNGHGHPDPQGGSVGDPSEQM